jgi:hypothetical protein
MENPSDDLRGVEILKISEDTFRELAGRHATSPEIGRIATCLDSDADPPPNGEPYILGLIGCGKLCGAVCCSFAKSKLDDSYACKLDSVIVDARLRNQGLASLLVAQAFQHILADPDREISSIYAHSVHPATVKLLRRLSFRDPPTLGAPLSSFSVHDASRKGLVTLCKRQIQWVTDRLKLQCTFCKAKDKRARPWCKP